MNQRIRELAEQSTSTVSVNHEGYRGKGYTEQVEFFDKEKFAELIVKEMCGLMEQAEDDAYHCFEPSERPTEYIEWLRDWQERVAKHFGVEE